MEKFFQLGGFIPVHVASTLQLLILLENMVNCSFDNLEIISIVHYTRDHRVKCVTVKTESDIE